MPAEEVLATTATDKNGSSGEEEEDEEETCWYVCGICSQAFQEFKSLKKHRKREHPSKATQLIVFTQRELQPQIKLAKCIYKENQHQQNHVLESSNSVALDLETAGKVNIKPRRGRKPGRRQTVVGIEPKLCQASQSETPDRLQLHERKVAQRKISKTKPSNIKSRGPGVADAQMLILTQRQLLPQINILRCDLNHQASASGCSDIEATVESHIITGNRNDTPEIPDTDDLEDMEGELSPKNVPKIEPEQGTTASQVQIGPAGTADLETHRQEGSIDPLPEEEELAEGQCSQNEDNQPRRGIKLEASPAEAPEPEPDNNEELRDLKIECISLALATTSEDLVLEFPTNSSPEIQTPEVFTDAHDSSQDPNFNIAVNPIPPMEYEVDSKSASLESPTMCPPTSPTMSTCLEEPEEESDLSDQHQQQIQILDFDNDTMEEMEVEEHGERIERKPDPPPPELDESIDDVQEDNVPARTLRPRNPVKYYMNEVDPNKSAKDTEFEMIYEDDPRPSSSLAMQDEDTATTTVAKMEEEEDPIITPNSPCKICGQVVAHRWDVSIHKLLHITPPGGKYPCEVCGKEYTFASLKYLRKHLMGHKESFSCPICGRTFTFRRYLENHMASHSRPRKGYLCPICGRSFPAPCIVRTHMETHSTERPYKCSKCDSSFKTRAILTKHNQSMHKDGLRPFCCPEPGCSKAFKVAETLRNHRKLVHADSSSAVRCPDCHKLYKNTEYLRMHRRTTHSGHAANKKEFKCAICHKSLSTKASLEIHQLKEHGKPYEKPVECDVCRKQFPNLNILKMHQAKHSAELPFQCTICGKRFKWDSNLWSHLTTHATEEEKRFQCHICGKKFALPHYLRQHGSVHNPEIQPRSRGARCKKPRKELQEVEKVSEESASTATAAVAAAPGE